MRKGILTIAIGKRYCRMSCNLVRSIWQFNPNKMIAIVTDEPKEFSALKGPITFVPFNSSYGEGVRQKLYLDYYTPFEKTLFIDSDCLIYGSLVSIWNQCQYVDFGVFGKNINDFQSWWYFKDASHEIIDKVSTIPRFNGGIY